MCKNCFFLKISCDMFVNFISVENLSKWPAYLWHAGEKKRWLKSRRSMVAWDSQIKTYVLNIHNMPKIFWGAWPLTTLERPKCSKVWVPLSKLSVGKNVWFTNAILGPLDFIHSEMLKRGMGGSGPPGKTASGEYYFRGWTPPRSNTRGYGTWCSNSLCTWAVGVTNEVWCFAGSKNQRKFHGVQFNFQWRRPTKASKPLHQNFRLFSKQPTTDKKGW